MKIAVFLPNWLGDFAMATPVLRALRGRYGPDAHIIGLMRPYLADVLRGTDWLDEQWFFEKKPERGVRATARRMREAGIDMALLTTNSLRPALAAWLGRARQRLGYARYGRGPLLTNKIYPKREGRKIVPARMIDSYLALAELADCPPESPRLELHTIAEERAQADLVFNNLGLRRDGRLVLINSSGAYGGAKLWSVRHFAKLSQRIAAELDHDVVVCCGPSEREIARDIVAAADHPRVFSMADQPMGLGVAKGVFERGRLMISTDSGPRHVAAALGVPTISIYGPMIPIWSENPSQLAMHVYLDIECAGCKGRTCPLGHHRCMEDLDADSVFPSVVEMLDHLDQPDEDDAAFRLRHVKVPYGSGQ